MEKTANNVEQFVKIKGITGITENGVIKLEMTDGSVYGAAFVPDNGVKIFPPQGVTIKRPVFDYDSGAVRGFAIGKAVE